jgi:hypothetical protein
MLFPVKTIEAVKYAILILPGLALGCSPKTQAGCLVLFAFAMHKARRFYVSGVSLAVATVLDSANVWWLPVFGIGTVFQPKRWTEVLSQLSIYVMAFSVFRGTVEIDVNDNVVSLLNIVCLLAGPNVWKRIYLGIAFSSTSSRFTCLAWSGGFAMLTREYSVHSLEDISRKVIAPIIAAATFTYSGLFERPLFFKLTRYAIIDETLLWSGSCLVLSQPDVTLARFAIPAIFILGRHSHLASYFIVLLRVTTTG